MIGVSEWVLLEVFSSLPFEGWQDMVRSFGYDGYALALVPEFGPGTSELDGGNENLEIHPLASVFSGSKTAILSTAEEDYGSFIRDVRGTMISMSRGNGSRVAIRYPRIIARGEQNIGTIQLYSCCGFDLTDEWAPLSKPLGGTNSSESFEFVAMADKEPWLVVAIRDTNGEENGRYQVYTIGDDQEVYAVGGAIDAGSSAPYTTNFRTSADISFEGSVIAVGVQKPGTELRLAIQTFLYAPTTNSYTQKGTDIEIESVNGY